MRYLLWDVETSHMIAATFQLRDIDLQPDNIIQDWYIICAAWKFLDEDKVYTVSVSSKDPSNDYGVVKFLLEVLSQSDCLIAHNGDAFDLKKLNTRAIYHGFKPLPPLRTIDTLKVARRYFKFSSNRLDYLGKFLGVGEKQATSPGLWMRVLKGDFGAIREMVQYNKQDVRLLEKVYLKLRPYMTSHPNEGIGLGVPACRNCGSVHIKRNGHKYTLTGKIQRLTCVDCGAWMTENTATGKAILK